MFVKKIVIGRKDIADFEKLGLLSIEVKVDSGAYTSSFHCHKISCIEKEGENWVKCNFLDPDHEMYHEKEFCFPVHKTRRVKSSNGMVEERYSIITDIKIFENIYPIELTLTERQDMKHPVLLGRKFLSKKFIVDTSKKNLSKKREKIEIKLPKKADR
ncbi:peptidase [Maribellus comscasis]|uniref:Peptidase n=1 Tax=Maribellus comscasis TaxID=2681766 RepID=A0A6I6JQ31_9BACT|nr:RimK/LysX family protein [Maribellus comscasis]QGY45086.1 peptidase [Maribellus comscasis]